MKQSEIDALLYILNKNRRLDLYSKIINKTLDDVKRRIGHLDDGSCLCSAISAAIDKLKRT